MTASIALALMLAACASDAPADATSPAAPGSTADAPMSAPPDTAPSTPEGPSAPEPPNDGTDIDWATVDLTTIDWATIDMQTVDWEAIQDNPTTSDLDQEQIGLIGSRMNRGSATLTIGDEVFEFDTFACARGHDNTESQTYSFTTNSFQTFDGVDTQMQVTIADSSSTGQVTGDGTTHRIDFNDIDDFENPSIDWSMNTPNAVTIDGHTVTVEGVFNDGTTPEVAEEIPGRLEATCSDDSRF